MLFAELKSKVLCGIPFVDYDSLSRFFSKVNVNEKKWLVFFLACLLKCRLILFDWVLEFVLTLGLAEIIHIALHTGNRIESSHRALLGFARLILNRLLTLVSWGSSSTVLSEVRINLWVLAALVCNSLRSSCIKRSVIGIDSSTFTAFIQDNSSLSKLLNSLSFFSSLLHSFNLLEHLLVILDNTSSSVYIFLRQTLNVRSKCTLASIFFIFNFFTCLVFLRSLLQLFCQSVQIIESVTSLWHKTSLARFTTFPS